MVSFSPPVVPTQLKHSHLGYINPYLSYHKKTTNKKPNVHNMSDTCKVEQTWPIASILIGTLHLYTDCTDTPQPAIHRALHIAVSASHRALVSTVLIGSKDSGPTKSKNYCIFTSISLFHVTLIYTDKV